MRRNRIKNNLTTDFDVSKSKDEKAVEMALRTLGSTYPEQTYDAMEDYLDVFNVLRKTKYWRIHAILPMLKQLYIYPTRGNHNELLAELHDIKETLHEDRIKNALDGLEAQKNASFGETKNKIHPVIWGTPLLIILGVLLIKMK